MAMFHLHGARAAQNARQHGDALFREGVGRTGAPPPPTAIQVEHSSRATETLTDSATSIFFFMTADEHKIESHVSSSGRIGAHYASLRLHGQGVAMLSSVLRSPRAVQVNIAIMRTFVRLREMLATNQKLRRKIEDMEKRYDAKLQIVSPPSKACSRTKICQTRHRIPCSRDEAKMSRNSGNDYL